MKRLLILLCLLPIFLTGQDLDISDGNFTYISSYFTIDSDSVDLPGAIAQFHRIDSINVFAANVWRDVQFDILIANESTYGYKFNADSTGFYPSFAGVTRVQGCGHWDWSGSAASNVKVYIRVLINNVEARCLQANETRGRLTSENGRLEFCGTIHHTINQEIAIQYRVDNAAMDWEGASVFDNPVAFSVNFEKISND